MQLYFLFFECILAELMGGRNSLLNNDRNIFFSWFSKKQKWFEKHQPSCQKPKQERKELGTELLLWHRVAPLFPGVGAAGVYGGA